jgi:hypothetical protein
VTTEPDNADCYALNVSARAYYYTGFPLIRVTDTETVPFPPGPVRGARAVLVHDDVLIFVGGYGKSNQLTDCRLRGEPLVRSSKPTWLIFVGIPPR